MKITLNKIRECKPCEPGWEKLLKGLGKTKADDEEFDVSFILKNNGLDDFCWVLDEVLNKKKELRLFAYWNAKQCLKYISDNEKEEYKKVINTINLFVYGKVDEPALDSTWDSIRYSALESAFESALFSAWTSARCSAWDSAWVSARDSARNSALASDRNSALESAQKSVRDNYIKKAEEKLLDILKGNLPAEYKGTNHY